MDFCSKKWWFIQILLYWWFNQEWRFICIDRVWKRLKQIVVGSGAMDFLSILDRHQVWRSHDPTSVQNFPFCEKKDFIPHFWFASFLYNSLRFPFKKTQLYCSVILLPVILLRVILLLVIFPVIWCFPIWLTTSLSYPMAIFSANEIRTFFEWFLSKSKSEHHWHITRLDRSGVTRPE